MYSNSPITHFQTTSFRVEDSESFLKIPNVSRFINEMKNRSLSAISFNAFLSFGLPPKSFSSKFDDLGKPLSTEDLINLMQNIEHHIHPDDTCNLNYVQHALGESLKFCSVVISKGKTTGYCSSCDVNNIFGNEDTVQLGGITNTSE